MKLELLILPLLIAANSYAFAQGTQYCKQDSISTEKNKNKLEYRQQFENTFLDQSSDLFSRGGQIRTIPVVVHVLHQGGIENISDAQVLSQIDALNKDFRRFNHDTVNTNLIFKSIAADIEVEFCLASKDPFQNATNGIDRIWVMDSTLSSTNLIDLYGWDRKEYLNFYISKWIGSFSSFPWSPDSTDGIFITHGRFGTTGTAGSEPFAEFGKFGRTATHEVGHYLGLYHTFDLAIVCDTALGDFVYDTPPCNGRWFVEGCLSHSTNTCTESPDLPDQVDNYMDYNIDSCMNMFSEGQKSRIHSMLSLYRPELWSDSNLVKTGCWGPVGLPENNNNTYLRIYPNPAYQYTIIEFDNAKNENFTLTLYNSAGQVIRTTSNIESNFILIEKDELKSGLYFFQLSYKEQLRYQGKLIFD